MAQVFLIDRDARTRAAARRAPEGAGHTNAEIADDREAKMALRGTPSSGFAGHHTYILTATDHLPLPPVSHDRATGRSLPVLLKPFDVATLVALVERAATVDAAAAPIEGTH